MRKVTLTSALEYPIHRGLSWFRYYHLTYIASMPKMPGETERIWIEGVSKLNLSWSPSADSSGWAETCKDEKLCRDGRRWRRQRGALLISAQMEGRTKYTYTLQCGRWKDAPHPFILIPLPPPAQHYPHSAISLCLDSSSHLPPSLIPPPLPLTRPWLTDIFASHLSSIFFFPSFDDLMTISVWSPSKRTRVMSTFMRENSILGVWRTLKDNSRSPHLSPQSLSAK